MEYKSRKANRLPGYDYSDRGIYFITLCTNRGECLLGDIDESPTTPALVELSAYGHIVSRLLHDIPTYYRHLSIEKYIIMPNHVHFLLSVQTSTTPERAGANAVVPKFVSTFKRFVNREIGINIWQRSYYDHIVRNERSYQKIWQYIDENPTKWREDRFYCNRNTM